MVIQVYHKQPDVKFMERKQTLRKSNLHQTNKAFNILSGSVIKMQFKKPDPIPKRKTNPASQRQFLSRTDPSIFISISPGFIEVIQPLIFEIYTQYLGKTK